MSKRTVFEDEHGIFIRINGSIYRPQPTRWSTPPRVVNGLWLSVTGTSYAKKGDRVEAKWINATPCTVVNGTELWVSHDDGWEGAP